MKLKETTSQYTGPRNVFYPAETRELKCILGLWIRWGITGNKKISPMSLFSLDHSLSSIGTFHHYFFKNNFPDAHLSFSRDRYIALLSALRFDDFKNRPTGKDAPISEV